ncbi:hypothetical protein [Ferruginibacter albus]|uniref:hypothetical protein n=1 Tax=Ferruginibacter albus TaxID=2875540 RepID=UPI001CC5D583|nr:hypothetical protein [Ferruginibacter albus]UAY50655.1 hypothetical protein K9M53_08615 [Ferruginibacter albus]
MKTIMISLLIILVATSFKKTVNPIVGKWERFYLRMGDSNTDGKDTLYAPKFSEETYPHGKSAIIEFKENDSCFMYDFRETSGKTIKRSKYVLIDNNKIHIDQEYDTLLYSIIKDTLIIRDKDNFFISKFLRQ